MKKNQTSQYYSIIIASRGRTKSLLRLLESIKELDYKPLEIVIVESLTNSEGKIKQLKFRGTLINYFYFQGFGQIQQKQIGISLLQRNVDWVLFVDDDVLLKPNAISELFSTLQEQRDQHQILGMGLANQLSLAKNTNLFKKLRRTKQGKVLKDGSNIPYMKSNKVIKTEWLNGTSMWRYRILKYYCFKITNVKYSICEDLIFSYKVSKLGTLIYVPTAIYSEQINSPALRDYEIFKYLLYMKLYFVLYNKNLSKFFFLITSILFYLKRAITLKSYQFLKVNFVYIKDVFFLIFQDINDSETIKRIERAVSS